MSTTASWRRIASGSVAPTLTDVAVLVGLRLGAELPLVVADSAAVALASAVSYVVHRTATFRSDPYRRWVRMPMAFVVVAVVAGAVDVVVLRAVFAATGFDSLGGIVAAKAVALAAAGVVRAVGYRSVLHEVLARARTHPRGAPLAPGSLRLSVVVPAYREPDRIGSTVDRLRSGLSGLGAGAVEIVVVDDGSGDGTAEAAFAAGADQVVVQPVNRGKGAAVAAGVAASRGRCVAFTDADLAYDPSHLLALVDAVETGWDVVIGSRQHPDSVVERSSRIRAAGSRLVNVISSSVLLAAPRDTQCGLKGFRGDVARSLFRHLRIDGFAFDIEVLHMVERAELSLLEIPVRLDETGAPSTVRVGADLVRLARDLVRVRRWASRGAYDAVTPGMFEPRHA